MVRIVTAAVLLIGDEILSGRTQDTNLKTIADFLAPLGVEVREARVVPDVEARIVGAVNALRTAYDYVFTTGGIGPTHDDITADSMAKAFGVSIGVREDAAALLRPYIVSRGLEVTEARMRMARIPDTASLIANPTSVAPGFQIGNVFVMAGIPSVMRGMLLDVGRRIEGGARLLSATVRGAGLREGDIAVPLGDLANASPEVSLGSYPWMRMGEGGKPDYGVSLVARSRDAERLDAALQALVKIVEAQGVAPVIEDGSQPT